ncbi:hypothetical protein JW968_00690 [Candidatus Woesearchaeota archaeon]|nr:hypothetical protein [Candidatus Woesearchaeota archaeon]
MELEIKGLHCKACKGLIEDIMEEQGAKISSFKVDEKSKIGVLTIKTERSSKNIISSIESEGDYKVRIQ